MDPKRKKLPSPTCTTYFPHADLRASLHIVLYVLYRYVYKYTCIYRFMYGHGHYNFESGVRKWSCLFVWESISINFLCCFQDVAFNNALANFQQPMNVKTRDSNIWLYWAWDLHTLQSCWVVWIACQGSIRILSPHLIRKWNKKVDYDVIKVAFLIPHGPTKKHSHTHTHRTVCWPERPRFCSCWLAPASLMCNSCTWICRVMFLIQSALLPWPEQELLAKCPSKTLPHLWFVGSIYLEKFRRFLRFRP